MAGLTEAEAHLFDQHGFLVIPRAIVDADVTRMRGLAEQWQNSADAAYERDPESKGSDGLPAPLTNSSRAPGTPEFVTAPRWLNNVHFADDSYARAVTDPTLLRIVGTLTGDSPILVNTQVMRLDARSDPIRLHATVGGKWGYSKGDPRITSPEEENYRLQEQADGSLVPWAGFVNVGISLVDVPPESGFCCCPGSHKNWLSPPGDLGTGGGSLEPAISVDAGGPSVFTPALQAGDAIVFTEGLTHGARRWSASYTRYTLYSRFTAYDYRHIHTVTPTTDMLEGTSRPRFGVRWRRNGCDHQRRQVTALIRALEDPEGRGEGWRLPEHATAVGSRL
jgi:hypothetical protein